MSDEKNYSLDRVGVSTRAPEMKEVVIWEVGIGFMKLQVMDVAPVDEGFYGLRPYTEPWLRISLLEAKDHSLHNIAQHDVVGADLDVLLLAVSQTRSPGELLAAQRRVHNKALKAYKRHEDLSRPSKLAYYESDMKSAEDLGRDIARTFKDEVQLLIASEEEHLAEYALRSYAGVANAITIDGERWVVNKVANKLTLSRTTAAADPESVVIDEKALMCADEPLVELVRRRIADSRKTD